MRGGLVLAWVLAGGRTGVGARLVVSALIVSALLIGLVPPREAAAQLPGPALLAPGHGETTNATAYPPNGVPTFAWQAVEGAAYYRIDVNSAAGFNGIKLVDNVRTYTTTYTPTNNSNFSGGTYYWRVRAFTSSHVGGDFSDIRGFTQTIGLRAQPLSPADNPTQDPTQALLFTPRFRWTAVTGASRYRLDISTDPFFGTSVSGYPKAVLGTSFTPTAAFANDTDYYWRVRAEDRRGNVGPWSTARGFVMHWSYDDKRPALLTPTNAAQNVSLPMFSWTPVQGAATYELVVHEEDPTVNDPGKRKISLKTPNTSYLYNLDKIKGWTHGTLAANTTYYWRVQAYNADNKAVGQRSEIFSFRSGDGTPVSPNLLYPPVYYTPSAVDPEPPYGAISTENFEDFTVNVPTFVWDRLPGAHTYRLEVAANQNFSPLTWWVETNNLSATPTENVSFDPDQIYYWRVRAVGTGLWSQTWRTRIDAGAVPRPGAAGAAPALLRPTYKTEWDGKKYGQEIVEFFPSLQWAGVQGATRYRVQFGLDPTFANDKVEVETAYTHYTPTAPVAIPTAANQLPDALPYGTYHWRVQSRDGAGVWSAWSSPSLFILESPPKFAADISALPLHAIAGDVPGDLFEPGPGEGVFDLSNLYVALGQNDWFFGFNSQAGAGSVRYLLYIDTDHAEGHGGTSDPLGMNIALDSASPHRPEYVISLDIVDGVLAASQASLWTWQPGTLQWVETRFSEVGWGANAATYRQVDEFVEVSIPKTLLMVPGMQSAASLSLKLFSTSLTAGTTAYDTLPNETPGRLAARAAGPFRSFVTTTRAPGAIYPFNASGDDLILRTTPRFVWHTLDGVLTYRFQAARDGGFSTIVNHGYAEEGWSPNDMLYSAFNPYYSPRSAWGDNPTYYWRMSLVNPWAGTEAWGETVTFRLETFAPNNLSVSPSEGGSPPLVNVQPTFHWDAVQGASQYRLEVIRDGDTFGSPYFTVETENTTFTRDTATLPDGTYHWRVRVKKPSGAYGPPSATHTFVKQYPRPTLISPTSGSTHVGIPAFKWTPLDQASYYNIQTATDPNFTQGLKSVDTDNCSYTPVDNWSDRTYYWRVAMVDGSGNKGPYQDATVLVGALPYKVLIPWVSRQN